MKRLYYTEEEKDLVINALIDSGMTVSQFSREVTEIEGLDEMGVPKMTTVYKWLSDKGISPPSGAVTRNTIEEPKEEKTEEKVEDKSEEKEEERPEEKTEEKVEGEEGEKVVLKERVESLPTVVVETSSESPASVPSPASSLDISKVLIWGGVALGGVAVIFLLQKMIKKKPSSKPKEENVNRHPDGGNPFKRSEGGYRTIDQL